MSTFELKEGKGNIMPNSKSDEKRDYQNPDPQQKNYQTFCGT